ncbi:hypothetical protein GCK72_022914 [Caenorhabditis remanei]|uniref:Uncharacterized protein n=1 Tax=Caenorhabditis remanei TaxID=31234 RepID=A0A6A5FV19_CAERE|nr:hypothetical protein GCK72_022914 [Caenorhabditis remanei]KAF1746458.1 hypothetical protein GCK72_022914 [Caenorhabditis remanei]
MNFQYFVKWPPNAKTLDKVSLRIRTARCSKRIRVVIKAYGRDIGYNTWKPEQKDRFNLKERIDLFHLFRESEPEEFQARFQLGITIGDQLICRLEIHRPNDVFFESLQICFESIQSFDENDTSIEQLNLGSMVPVVKKENFNILKLFYTYSQNQLEGFIKAVYYFESIFGCRLMSVRINGTDADEFSMNFKNVVERLNLSHIVMNDWELYNLATVSEKDLSYILENVNTKLLSYGFCRGNNAANHRQERFLLDNLKNIKCSRMLLSVSNCTNRTMINFISNWLSAPVVWGRSMYVTLKENVNMQSIITGLSERKSGEQVGYNVVQQSNRHWQIITSCNKKLQIGLSPKGLMMVVENDTEH